MGNSFNIIQQCDLFDGLSPAQLAQVETLFTARAYPPGAAVFLENAPDQELFVVSRGEVQLSVSAALVTSDPLKAAARKSLAVLRRGQSFGEVALVDEGVRTASAYAGQNGADLQVISRRDLLDLCAGDPALGYRLMFNLAISLSQKIREADLTIREMLADLPPAP
jgi:CRP-like cAMP-binding protein